MKSLTVGMLVHLVRPYGRHTHGVLTKIYGMVSAAGIKRTKYVVQFPHSRTKTKTVEVAYEIDDFSSWS